MLVPLCRHIKTNGIRCKSPAINRLPYCYYHFRSLQRHRPYRYPSNAKDYAIKPLHIELHLIEDAESIQSALSKVINAVAVGCLAPDRAAPILRGLHIASINLDRLSANVKPDEMITNCNSTDDDLDLADALEYPDTSLPEVDKVPQLSQANPDKPQPSELIERSTKSQCRDRKCSLESVTRIRSSE